MTGEDLISLMIMNNPKEHTDNSGEKKHNKPRNLVYGYTGLAELLHCSTATSGKIIRSGKIKKAVRQVGRKIVIDADLALDLLARR